MTPSNRTNSLKDPELYEKLRDEGDSKEKAARISNAAAARGRSAIAPNSSAYTTCLRALVAPVLCPITGLPRDD